MPRYRIDLEYEGTRYSGWQVQKDARTVQGELMKAVAELQQHPCRELKGAGRTDAGVHALQQTAHADLDVRLPVHKLAHELNDRLPPDINVLRVRPVPAAFHARHDVTMRSYLYQIARRRTAFGKRFVWWIKDSLDAGRMRDASRLFVGMRDMRSFAAQLAPGAETRVKLEDVRVEEVGDLLVVRLVASHFLWKMVRQMVGVIVEVGRGKLTAKDVEGFLAAPSDVPAKLTAPPSGLFLERAWYPGEGLPTPEDVITAPFPVRRPA